VKDVLRTVPLSPFAPIRSVIAKKMQENEEKNIKIVAGSKKSRTFATAIEKQRLQRKRVPWMSGLVSGLQNRVRRFESARNLKKQERIRMKISNPFVFQLLTSSVVEGLEEEFSWLSCNSWGINIY
jgi:CCR4-NOT transcriptional regulation complex NOT5 subunit